MWIWLVLLYGIFKGLREVCKKKAMEISSPLEVLLVYTIISFVFVVPDARNAMGLPAKYFGWIALKSFVIFVAWILSFYAIKKLPISLFGVLDLSRILFSTFLGVTFLGEVMSPLQIVGLIFVCAGLFSLKFQNFHKRQSSSAEKASCCESESRKFLENSSSVEKTSSAVNLPFNMSSYPSLQKTLPLKKHFFRKETVYVLMAFLSCAFNAISGFMDKILMKGMNSSQLQFWYMLFLVIFYLIFTMSIRKKIEINFIRTFKNKWVWILSILFIIADRALFIANGMEESRVTVMTLIKQSGSIVTILAGRFIFKEKGTLHKLICASVIIIGIFLGV